MEPAFFYLTSPAAARYSIPDFCNNNPQRDNMSKPKNSPSARKLAVALVMAAPLGAAMATNGYFSHGYGMKAKGMGGAAATATDNSFAGANNPAASAWAGDRAELGVDLFMPKRGMSRTGSPFGFNASVDSDKNRFFVPELGFNRAISNQLGVGFTIYGNGGLNTDYAGGQLNCGGGPNTSNTLCGSGRLGVDLIQLIVAPTVAYKFNEQHSIGISPLLVHQRFKAQGLQAFTAPGSSSAPASVTNNGTDTSNGVGVRFGYLGKLSSAFSVGASYAPKIGMSKFEKYAGLFADGGDFDIPANYTLGLSFQPVPAVTLALDYQRIKYSGVRAVSNPSSPPVAQLGAPNGPGFGWSDINVVKLGVQWQVMPALALRAGFNSGGNPIQGRDVTFNILAPGVTTQHYTFGGTYTLSPGTELTMSYMQAPTQSVTAVSPGFGGTETIRMSQRALGIQMGWRF